MSDIFSNNGGWSQSQLYDPWVGDVQQSYRIRAFCFIEVSGVDVTNRLDPHLISVHIIDGAPQTCHIELDDRYASLPIPPLGAPVTVFLGWVNNIEQALRVFQGVVRDVESGFARKQGGRRLWVHASGYNDLTTRIKEPMDFHLGDGAPPGYSIGDQHTAESFLSSVAANAGGIASIHPQIATQMRDYWAQSGESAANVYDRLAKELGTFWRVQDGNKLVMTIPGWTVSGLRTTVKDQWQQTFTVQAVWARNLIGWRVRPISSRPTWQGARQQYYDHIMGDWMNQMKQFGFPMPWGIGTATFAIPTPAPNSQVGNQQNTANEVLTGYSMGGGRIIINGEPRAQWQGFVVLIGARPGVDGTYLIKQAEHIYSRQGYITWLDVTPVALTGGPSISDSYKQRQQTPDVPPLNTPGALGPGL